MLIENNLIAVYDRFTNRREKTYWCRFDGDRIIEPPLIHRTVVTLCPATDLNDAVLQVVEMLGVIDDLHLVGRGAADAGEPDVLVLDLLV